MSCVGGGGPVACLSWPRPETKQIARDPGGEGDREELTTQFSLHRDAW